MRGIVSAKDIIALNVLKYHHEITENHTLRLQTR